MRVPDQELYNIALKEFHMLDGLGEGHLNIMKVYDIFYNTARENMFIVMEYAGKGNNLATLIKALKPSIATLNIDKDEATKAESIEDKSNLKEEGY